MRKPTDTTESHKDTLRASAAAGIPVGSLVTPGSIEAQEAAGQREMLFSDVLPTDMRNTQEDFEALGFTFGPVNADDPIFRAATLPEGWSREGSDHAMWSYIIDARGFRRASIFYKAAFYDRSAHIGIIPADRAETAAQNATYEAFHQAMTGNDNDSREWKTYDSRKDGDNLIRIATQYVVNAGGQRKQLPSDQWTDNERYEVTGMRIQWTIAPNGSVLEEREIHA